MEDKELHRQIHPNLVQNGHVSTEAFQSLTHIQSTAFTPSRSDQDLLSVYNGDVFSSEESYNHYTENHISYGVLTVLESEVLRTTPLSIIDDNWPFHGHNSIDFSLITTSNKKKKAGGYLRDYAQERGWTYKP